jgi:hypothetical protein
MGSPSTPCEVRLLISDELSSQTEEPDIRFTASAQRAVIPDTDMVYFRGVLIRVLLLRLYFLIEHKDEVFTGFQRFL